MMGSVPWSSCGEVNPDEQLCRQTWNLLSHLDSTTASCSPASICPFKQTGDLMRHLGQIIEKHGFEPNPAMTQWHHIFKGKRMIASLSQDWHLTTSNHERVPLIVDLCTTAFFLDPRRRSLDPRFFYGVAWWEEHLKEHLEDPVEDLRILISMWIKRVLRYPEQFQYYLQDTKPWDPERGWTDNQAVYFRAKLEDDDPLRPRYGVLVAAPITVIADPENASWLGDHLAELREDGRSKTQYGHPSVP